MQNILDAMSDAQVSLLDMECGPGSQLARSIMNASLDDSPLTAMVLELRTVLGSLREGLSRLESFSPTEGLLHAGVQKFRLLPLDVGGPHVFTT